MENAINFVQTTSTSCTCLGHIVTYECTVIRGLGTIWTGSAFTCTSSSNEIYLLENTGNSFRCSNGMITGRVIRTGDESYTSQLNVIVGSDLIGKNISCAHTDGSATGIVGSSTIVFTTTGM